jgi:hypothetical protein
MLITALCRLACAGPSAPPTPLAPAPLQVEGEWADSALQVTGPGLTSTLRQLVALTQPTERWARYHEAHLRRFRRAIQVGVAPGAAVAGCRGGGAAGAGLHQRTPACRVRRPFRPQSRSAARGHLHLGQR